MNGTQTVRKDDASSAQAMDEEMDTMSYTPVQELQRHGIAAGDIKKLQEHGINTVNALSQTSRRKLVMIKGLSEAKCEKMFEIAEKVAPVSAFQSGKLLHEHRQANLFRITTGGSELDKMLGGGVETGSITELNGEYRVGKSQICMTLAVASQMPEELGGGEGRALIFDTEGTFRPERVLEIASRFDLNGEDVLDNLQIARIYTPDHLEKALVKASALLVQEEYRILIIDSIIAPFRFEYCGRGELAERQQRLGAILVTLKKMADEFNLAVVLTNQVCADPGAMAAFVPDAKKAVGGHVLAHAVDTRIQLRKGKGDQRVAKIIDSPWRAEQEAVYTIGPGGIIDATD